MDIWESFNDTLLPDKKGILQSWKTLQDTDYKHAVKVWKTFEIKNLDEYHYLHV